MGFISFPTQIFRLLLNDKKHGLLIKMFEQKNIYTYRYSY